MLFWYRNHNNSRKEEGLLESQEGDGWAMLKMIWRKWVLRGWRKITRDKDAWKLILEEAKSCMDRRANGEEKNHNHSHIHYPVTSAAANDDDGSNDSCDDDDSNTVNGFR